VTSASSKAATCRVRRTGAATWSNRTWSSSGTAPSSACTSACAGAGTARPGPIACYTRKESRAMSRSVPAEHAGQHGFTVHTRGRGFTEITNQVADVVAASGVQLGIAHVFTAHTSCSMLLIENDYPTVREDLERWLARAVPDGDAIFQHDAEGPDDMPAH